MILIHARIISEHEDVIVISGKCPICDNENNPKPVYRSQLSGQLGYREDQRCEKCNKVFKLQILPKGGTVLLDS